MFTGCSISRKPAGRTPRHEGRCRVLRRPAGIALDAALRDIDVLCDDLPRDKATAVRQDEHRHCRILVMGQAVE
ncbi:hypothetical protein E5D57_001422 [Metarhizium anisopliae]|nr:hypothetical protein E5D57_001422 [Metarhizium anisopliae]